ncbi:hypothetical protein PR048_032042 [Dryococelus australis]|uniref:Uncharacterized protein n=1 Tax=Dryococelus australis TaxID=614101 RepID=A0ABQ9G7J8_9NEOP|nr:hypothetical protein PR048_032042 [Dryococelus australis]
MKVNRIKFPTGIPPTYSHVKIEQDNATGLWVFSGISRFPSPFIAVLLHTNLASPPSVLKTSILRATEISSLIHCSLLLTHGTLGHAARTLTAWPRCSHKHTWPRSSHKGHLAMLLEHGTLGHAARTQDTWLRSSHTGHLAMLREHGTLGHVARTRDTWPCCSNTGHLAMLREHRTLGHVARTWDTWPCWSHTGHLAT